MRIVIVPVVIAALALTGTAAIAGPDGSLDLFPFGVDPGSGVATTVDFGSCQGTASPVFGGFGRKYIIGLFTRLNGATAAGISGAELYIQGLETTQIPAGFQVVVTFPANTIQPFGSLSLCQPRLVDGVPNRTCNTTWVDVTGPDAPNCQKAVLTEIARIELTQLPAATDIENDHYVTVVGGDPPGNPNFECPSLVLCNAPFYNQVCVTGGQFIINPVQFSCNPAVDEATWGAVKGLYR